MADIPDDPIALPWSWFGDYFVDQYFSMGYLDGTAGVPVPVAPGKKKGGAARPLRALVHPSKPPYEEPPAVPMELPEDEEALIMLARELL